jgi:hypothetical protein
MKINTNITLEEGDAVTVVRGGVKVTFNASGIDVNGNVPVTLHPAANDAATLAKQTEPRIGERMPDGTVYAGTSPDTGKPMYTTPADAPLTMKWIKAMQLEAHGHKDWKLPSQAEQDVLFANRTAIGGFNTSGSFPAGYYWSSSEGSNVSAWFQRFSDGLQDFSLKSYGLSVRCVRR